MTHITMRTLCLPLSVFMLFTSISFGQGKVKQIREIPDLTNPATKMPYGLPDNALGTTGAFGWIYHSGKNYSSENVRQVLVTRVLPKSPADGVLQKGDVILGVAAGSASRAFKTNARRELGLALLNAEDEANKGLVSLTVFRKGKTRELQLTIPIIAGAYDASSPVTCPRTHTLISMLAATIHKRGLPEGKWLSIFDALGLLATGDKTYHPMLKEFATSLAITKPLDLNSREKTAWSWGYKTLFLSEYYGVTGDDSVLPDLTEYATKLAMGQSYAGTWNHCVANPDMWENNGKLHGRLGGYGAINQTTLSCAIGLAVAQKVGVDNKEIADAIRRTTEHFLFFVDKGSIPYGDNRPGNGHAANGKNASAAVFFDLLGKKEAASYFSRLTVASYGQREGGHTGHFLSQFWGGPGAACSGKEALNAFTNELQAYLQLERRADGDCVYQSVMNADIGHYKGWSMNGARLLQYCAPRKVLFITGKTRTTSELKGDELAETIHAGRFHLSDQQETQETLLSMLGSWSPVVRETAARRLGTLEENVAPKLIALLDCEDRYARYGACLALKYAGRGSEDAVDALLEKGVRSNDVTMRYFAVEAFSLPRFQDSPAGEALARATLGKAAEKAVDDLLKLAATEDPENDPRNKVQFILSENLFYNGRVQGFQGLLSKKRTLATADRNLLLNATRAILKNQNGRARQMIATTVYPELTQKERQELRDDIVVAVREQAPSCIMFSWTVREVGLQLLVADKDPEVPALCVKILQRWEEGRPPLHYLTPLAAYGAAAKPALPALREMLERRKANLKELEARAKGTGRKAKARQAKAEKDAKYIQELESVIRAIETAKEVSATDSISPEGVAP